MVVVYFYLYPRLPTSFRFKDPFFSIDLHRLNTRAIAERFGNHILAPGGGGGGGGGMSHWGLYIIRVNKNA